MFISLLNIFDKQKSDKKVYFSHPLRPENAGLLDITFLLENLIFITILI